MELQLIEGDFSVFRLNSADGLDLSHPFTFFAKTDDEVSLVCPAAAAPGSYAAAEHGWRLLKITGVLDFALVGIIARISGLLADAGISLFAVSTYNTDYFLVKQTVLEQTLEVLQQNGYSIAG